MKAFPTAIRLNTPTIDGEPRRTVPVAPALPRGRRVHRCPSLRSCGSRCATLAAIVLVLTNASAARAQHAHEDDLIVGQVAGQLAVEFDFDEAIPLAPVSSNPFGIVGWSADEPGFDHADGNDPDLGALGVGASIRLVGLTPFDAALLVRSPVLPFGVAIDASGGALDIGDHELHQHALWNIDSSAPGFDPNQALWTGTFRLIDVGTTGYAESEPFALTFTPVPEPVSLLGSALGIPLILRRKR